MEILRIVTGVMSENCYIIYDETKEAVLIDPGETAFKTLEELKKLELDLKYIVFTHGHFDHTRAYFKIRDEYQNALLAIGKNELCVIKDKSKSFLNTPVQINPDIRLSENDEIKAGNFSLSVIETPGHTSGSICLYTKGHLISGDTLFKEGMGRCDLPTGNLKEEVN